jgi:glutamine synthetase
MAADPEECRAFLEANPDIKYVEIVFTGMSSAPIGKRLRRHELMPIYTYGRFLPGSTQVVDITGQDAYDTGLVWENGDADMLARPAPGTLVRAPWLGDDTAQVLCSMHELDGTPSDLDPRAVLQNVINRFKADGLTPVAACELEFYLVDAQRAEDGGLQLPRHPITGERPTLNGVYGLREMEDIGDFLRDLWETADAQDVPLEGAIAEYGVGQVELTLRHKDDVLRAGDDAVMYKRLAKGVALVHGMEATFMAKPFSDQAGSGLHLHVSVASDTSKNIFASERPEGDPRLVHAIGGLKALLGESMAVFAPNANSFRRFRANSYAPVAPTWGVNNRTVSLRVPAGPPSTRHIEHRVAGADANPYLALAVLLAGVHYGITHQVDPGPMVTGDGYAAAAKSDERLPSNWFAAIEAFENSAILKDYLGERFVKMFCALKRQEQDRWFEVVTKLDLDWYLKNA